MSIDSINPVCREFGVSKPLEVADSDSQELTKLSDLGKILKMHTTMKVAADELKMIGVTLSPEALAVYSATKIDAPSATVKIIKTLEAVIKKINNRQDLAADRVKLTQMLDVMQKAVGLITDLGKKLSADGLKVYLNTLLEITEPSATAKIIKTMERTAQKMSDALSARSKTKFSLTVSKTFPEYGEVEAYIVSMCTPEEAPALVALVKEPEHAPAIPATLLPIEDGPNILVAAPSTAKKEALKKFDWMISGTAGYARRFVGKDKLELMSSADRALLGRLAVTGSVNLAENLNLNFDYKTSMSYDETGRDDLITNDDDGRVSVNYSTDSDNLLAQLGGRHYRTDYPTKTNPTISGGTEALYYNHKFSPNLSLNISQTFAGNLATTQKDTGAAFDATLQPTVTYTLDNGANFTAGAVVSYDSLNEGVAGGPVVGLGYSSGLNALYGIGSYSRSNKGSNSATAGLSYFYDSKYGIIANYSFSDHETTTHRADVMAGAKFSLWKDLFLEPLCGGTFGVVGGNAVVAPKAMLMLGYGKPLPSQPLTTVPGSITNNPLGGY